MNREEMAAQNHFFADEVVRESQEIEANRVDLYQEMALRFLPFNIGISRLMKELSKESKTRVGRLAEARRLLQLGDAPPAGLSSSASSKAHHQGHFFITDAVMAAATLEAASHEEYKVQGSYEWLKENNATPYLNSLLTGFIRQAKNQVSILQEARTEALLLGQWRRDQGILKRIS